MLKSRVVFACHDRAIFRLLFFSERFFRRYVGSMSNLYHSFGFLLFRFLFELNFKMMDPVNIFLLFDFEFIHAVE